MSWGKRTRKVFEEQAQRFKALGHPVRLQILRVLAEGEACVCHLETVLEKSQPYISQQLAVLREEGLVEDHRDGVIIYYRLADARLAQMVRTMFQLSQEEVDTPPESPLEECPCPRCRSARERHR